MNTPDCSHRTLAAWLGVLFVLLFALNTAGGWVRLSGSGVAIPDWPIIQMDDHRTVLPPFTSVQWDAVERSFQAHQARLRERVTRGELTQGNLGKAPADRGEFQQIFLTEWTHRLLVAVTGVVALVLLVRIISVAESRRIIGLPFSGACALIVLQAVIGGMLVDQGTNTHWLFLHQGNAGAIMSCLLWALLTLLAPGRSVQQGREWSMRIIGLAAFGTWLQLVFGALLAGSKAQEQGSISLPLSILPSLWEPARGMAWNLLDNHWLHQWLHRWWAWALGMIIVSVAIMALRQPSGERQRLAIQVAGTFLGVQLLLGISSVTMSSHAGIALAHQVMGMCLLMTLVMAWFDARYEPSSELTVVAQEAL